MRLSKSQRRRLLMQELRDQQRQQQQQQQQRRQQQRQQDVVDPRRLLRGLRRKFEEGLLTLRPLGVASQPSAPAEGWLATASDSSNVPTGTGLGATALTAAAAAAGDVQHPMDLSLQRPLITTSSRGSNMTSSKRRMRHFALPEGLLLAPRTERLPNKRLQQLLQLHPEPQQQPQQQQQQQGEAAAESEVRSAIQAASPMAPQMGRDSLCWLLMASSSSLLPVSPDVSTPHLLLLLLLLQALDAAPEPWDGYKPPGAVCSLRVFNDPDYAEGPVIEALIK